MIKSIKVEYKIFENEMRTDKHCKGIRDLNCSVDKLGDLVITRDGMIKDIYAHGVWKTVEIEQDYEEKAHE